jgi:hypothetical protein
MIAAVLEPSRFGSASMVSQNIRVKLSRGQYGRFSHRGIIPEHIDRFFTLRFCGYVILGP